MDRPIISIKFKEILRCIGYQEKETKIYNHIFMNQRFITSRMMKFQNEDVISKVVDVKKLSNSNLKL